MRSAPNPRSAGRLPRRRPHLTYANVMSTIAAFLALSGGVAWATHEVIDGSDIVDNSVLSADLKDDGTRSVDVRDDTRSGGGLAAQDLGAGSVGASEVLNGSLGTADTDPLVSGGNKFSVVPIDLGAPAGTTNLEAEPWGNGSLGLQAVCRFSSITNVSFVNESTSTATLNWLYGDGTSFFADGVALAANAELGSVKTFDFFDERIEGQFIYAGADSKITINLHAVDLGSSCEVHGTAARAAD
jgi:hypothetical protein